MAETQSNREHTPRHGRHMSSTSPNHVGTPRMAANSNALRMQLPTVDTGADATSARVPVTPETETPRPIGVDPAQTGSFRRLDAGQGAMLTTRENAELGHTAAMQALKGGDRIETTRLRAQSRPQVRSRQVKPQGNRKLFVILGAAAAVVIIAAILLVRGALLPSREGDEGGRVEQTQVPTDGTISYDGGTYALTTLDDGSNALAFTADGSQERQTVCSIPGSPVQLVLYNGAFLIPENLPDGTWDVLAYTLGSESVATPVIDLKSGEPISGKGTISSVELDGATLHVTDADGAITDVPLE